MIRNTIRPLQRTSKRSFPSRLIQAAPSFRRGSASRQFSNDSDTSDPSPIEPNVEPVIQPKIVKTPSRRKRIVVAVTGATGAPLAVSLLQTLHRLRVETHLILSTWGSATLKYELEPPNNTSTYLQSLANHSYSPRDVSASLSSGSFRTHGMIIVPCSMKTLAGIRIGYDNDLITRAASVTLKERRRLVLVARETPLSSIHLENMLEVTRAGAVVFPPAMAFYTRPKGIQELVDQSVRRMVDLLDLGLDEYEDDEGRWTGFDWEEKKKMNASQ